MPSSKRAKPTNPNSPNTYNKSTPYGIPSCMQTHKPISKPLHSSNTNRLSSRSKNKYNHLTMNWTKRKTNLSTNPTKLTPSSPLLKTPTKRLTDSKMIKTNSKWNCFSKTTPSNPCNTLSTKNISYKNNSKNAPKTYSESRNKKPPNSHKSNVSHKKSNPTSNLSNSNTKNWNRHKTN